MAKILGFDTPLLLCDTQFYFPFSSLLLCLTLMLSAIDHSVGSVFVYGAGGWFLNEDESTCSLKIILPRCTPLCQPCDVYFYKQVKNYIAKAQNCLVLTAANREPSSWEDNKNAHPHT
jgi:hypothetical protein